jgi:hypothetical protein
VPEWCLDFAFLRADDCNLHSQLDTVNVRNRTENQSSASGWCGGEVSAHALQLGGRRVRPTISPDCNENRRVVEKVKWE